MFGSLIRRKQTQRPLGDDNIAFESTTFSLSTAVPKPAERRGDERLMAMLRDFRIEAAHVRGLGHERGQGRLVIDQKQTRQWHSDKSPTPRPRRRLSSLSESPSNARNGILTQIHLLSRFDAFFVLFGRCLSHVWLAYPAKADPAAAG